MNENVARAQLDQSLTPQQRRQQYADEGYQKYQKRSKMPAWAEMPLSMAAFTPSMVGATGLGATALQSGVMSKQSTGKVQTAQQRRAYQKELGASGRVEQGSRILQSGMYAGFGANAVKGMMGGGGGAVNPFSPVYGGLSALAGGGLAGTAAAGGGLALPGLLAGMRTSKKMSRLQAPRSAPLQVESKYSSSKNMQASLNKLRMNDQLQPADELKTRLLMMIESHTSVIAPLYEKVRMMQEKKEKTTEAGGEAYKERFAGAESDISGAGKVMNRIEDSINTFISKYDPFTQLSNLIFTGKTPKQIYQDIQSRGEDKEEMKRLTQAADVTGIPSSAMRLLETDSLSLTTGASSHEERMYMLSSSKNDLIRYLLQEVISIRKHGFGIEENAFKRQMEQSSVGGLLEAIKDIPHQIPGLSAIANLVQAPQKIIETFTRAGGWLRDKVLGRDFLRLQQKEEAEKEAGIHKSLDQKYKEFIIEGLPNLLEDVRLTNVHQLEAQQNIYQVMKNQYELLSAVHTGKMESPVYRALQEEVKERRAYDPYEAAMLTAEALEKAEEKRAKQRRSVRAGAFEQGLLGSVLGSERMEKVTEKIRGITSATRGGINLMGPAIGEGQRTEEQEKRQERRSIIKTGRSEDVTEFSEERARKQREFAGPQQGAASKLGILGSIAATAATGGGALPLLLGAGSFGLGMGEYAKGKRQERTGFREYAQQELGERGMMGRAVGTTKEELEQQKFPSSPTTPAMAAKAATGKVDYNEKIFRILGFSETNTLRNFLTDKVQNLINLIREKSDNILEKLEKEEKDKPLEAFQTGGKIISFEGKDETDKLSKVAASGGKFNPGSLIITGEPRKSAGPGADLTGREEIINFRKDGKIEIIGQERTSRLFDRYGIESRSGLKDLGDDIKLMSTGTPGGKRVQLMAEGTDPQDNQNRIIQILSSIKDTITYYGERFLDFFLGQREQEQEFQQIQLNQRKKSFDNLREEINKQTVTISQVQEKRALEKGPVEGGMQEQLGDISEQRRREERLSKWDKMTNYLAEISESTEELEIRRKKREKEDRGIFGTIVGKLGDLIGMIGPLASAALPILGATAGAGGISWLTGGDIGGKAMASLMDKAARNVFSFFGKAIDKVGTRLVGEFSIKEIAKRYGSGLLKSAKTGIITIGENLITKLGKTFPKAADIATNLPLKNIFGSLGKWFTKLIGFAGKGAGKAATKIGLKKVPGLGAILGLGFGIHRFTKGEWFTGMLEIASGLASTVPVVGTAASIGLDTVIALTDWIGGGDKEEKTEKGKGKSWLTKLTGWIGDKFIGLSKWIIGGIPFVGGMLNTMIFGDKDETKIDKMTEEAKKEAKKKTKDSESIFNKMLNYFQSKSAAVLSQIPGVGGWLASFIAPEDKTPKSPSGQDIQKGTQNAAQKLRQRAREAGIDPEGRTPNELKVELNRKSRTGTFGFATGAIVTEPTRAVIGEKSRPEAVVPLTKGRFDKFARSIDLDKLRGEREEIERMEREAAAPAEAPPGETQQDTATQQQFVPYPMTMPSVDTGKKSDDKPDRTKLTEDIDQLIDQLFKNSGATFAESVKDYAFGNTASHRFH